MRTFVALGALALLPSIALADDAAHKKASMIEGCFNTNPKPCRDAGMSSITGSANLKAKCGVAVPVKIDDAIVAYDSQHVTSTAGSVDVVLGEAGSLCEHEQGFKARFVDKVKSIRFTQTTKPPAPRSDGTHWVAVKLDGSDLVVGFYPGVMNVEESLRELLPEAISPGMQVEEDTKRTNGCLNGDPSPCVAKDEGAPNHLAGAAQRCGARPMVEVDRALVANDRAQGNSSVESVDDFFKAFELACDQPALKAKLGKVKRVHFTFNSKSVSPNAVPLPTLSFASGVLTVGYFELMQDSTGATVSWIGKHL